MTASGIIAGLMLARVPEPQLTGTAIRAARAAAEPTANPFLFALLSIRQAPSRLDAEPLPVITTELTRYTGAALDCVHGDGGDLPQILDSVNRLVLRMMQQHGDEYRPLRIAAGRMSAALLSIGSAALDRPSDFLSRRLTGLHDAAEAAVVLEREIATAIPIQPRGSNVVFSTFGRGAPRRAVPQDAA